MFRTRQEVDKHVNNSLKKINNETERNLRCFSFAKLYFNVGDYEQTVRYVSSYLSVKPKSPEGHNLLGKALEKLGKKQAALEAYKTSLQQDPKQNNLVIKVCELMAQDDIDVDYSGASYFCDLAQSLDPQNPIVSNLKEKLITNDSKDPADVSQFLLKELENRPTDVNLRVRLLKHFLENHMVKEAYKHAFDIEQKKLGIFDSSIAWYETFAEVLVRYQRDSSISTQLTWEFWFLSASVLEKLASLSLNDHVENMKSTTDYVLAIFNFDQSFLKTSQSVDLCPDKLLLKEFLSHYEAQLCLHLSVLAFKQAKKDLMTFKEVQNIILPLLFVAYNVPVPDTQSVWFNNLPENRRLLVADWHKEASFRCSQAGNVLVALAKDRRNILLEKANQYSTGVWREQLFKKIFVKRDQQLKASTSFFISSALEPVIKLPDCRDLIKYSEVAQAVHPDSLHHYIWLALNYQNLSDYTLKSFDGLQYTVKNLNNCAAESLSILDMQSFVYCATLCAQSKIKNADSSLMYFNQDRPSVLPVSITGNLGTVNQAKFVLAAYRMYKHEYTSNMGEIRMILIKGIEVIRCAGNHGLDVKLLVTLASIFADRVKSLSKQSEIEANAARAELYWKTALPLLEKLKNEHALIYPNNRLFEYKSNKDLAQEEIAGYIEKARLFIGLQLMKKKEHEKAMHIFEGLKDPYASFYQSQIYKQMADSKTNHNRENVTSEMRSQNIILLSRARDCLYLTLDRLREPSQDRDHPLNAQLGTEIEKTERLLSRIDPDCANRNECDGMSDENVSDDSVGEHYLSTYTHHTSFHNGRDLSGKNDTMQMHSTPLRLSMIRQEARPSPERLDAQIRQLVATKDMAMNNVLEQNKMMVELQRSLADEIRGFKDSVKTLTSAVDERAKMFTGSFEDVKKMVDELTHSVDDRLQGVTDMVQEMRRELNDIKKDQNKNAQISVEDLYDLGKDPDYNSPLDYNLGNNLGNAQSNLNSMVGSLYPNYHRLPQAPAPNLAAYGGQGLYPGLYPGLPYPYGALGLGQPGALPFLPPPEQLAQIPNIPGITQPVYPSATAGLSHLALQAQQNIQAQSIQAPSVQPQIKESPKPIFSNANLVQTGFNVAPATQASPSMLQLKETPKAPIFSVSTPSSFAPSGFRGQSLNISSPTVAPPSSVNAQSTKAPPVNVVITSSDPLPTFKATTTQPILSVTIPPQHIKGNLQKPVPVTQTPSVPLSQVHNYQIPLPATNALSMTPSVLSQPPPLVSTQSLLSNVPSPAISAIARSPSKNVSLGIQIEQALDRTFSSPVKTNNSSFNKSNVSSTSVDEYDPRPDFQPIIPLPDEVPVTTGEEKETELFCQRAKLFRLVPVNGAKEWKERGVGNIKILHNPETGKVRLIMRREQVHKICANHFLTKDTSLSLMANNDRAYIWAAHDFADEQIVLEKFCARFKTAEEAKKFADAFNLAKAKINERPAAAKAFEIRQDFAPSTPTFEAIGSIAPPAQSTPTNLGGFKFFSTPTFKPKEEPKPAPKVEEPVKEPAIPSPFAAFSFGNKTTAGSPSKSLFDNIVTEPATFSPLVVSSQLGTPQRDEEDVEEDFVPTAEFKPVIEKLPDLVEIKTGEENAEVVFEERSKLFRMDTSGVKNEWKERGVGTIKVLKEGTLRLIMRRDQVHKVCLNHQVVKNMSFKKNFSDPKAVVWHAKDFSEGVLMPETFTARFKNEELANKFLQTVQNAQTTLDENNQVTGKHHKPDTPPKAGFGDKFKLAKGSWKCKNCYVVNEGKVNRCLACETSKAGSTPNKDEATFSFSVKSAPNSSQTEVTITPVPAAGWGNRYKPAAGSWECEMCYVTNSADSWKCMSCETPKEDTAAQAPSAAGGIKGISLDTGGLTFNFGVPPAAKPVITPAAPVTQRQEQPVQKFSFSVPPPTPVADPSAVLSGFGDSFKPKAGTWECKTCYIRNEPASLYCLSCDTPKDGSVPKKEPAAPKGVDLETPGLKFSFGMPATATTNVSSTFGFGDIPKPAFSWKPAETAVAESTTSKPSEMSEDSFVFGSPQKHGFEFKPRSPRRISTGPGDDSDASYVEEEEDNIYFKPVVALPDIVEVKTGEENEQVLYSHRAKLFRFTGGEWKERGLGDVKILKDNTSGKLRVVMRREQVHKICLNHWLTRDVEYLPKDEKTWLFHAADFSEGELARDQFCLRFKNAEVALAFKKSADDALGGADDVKPVAVEETEIEELDEPDSDSDVEFVSETQVTAEEEKEALRLGLPPKFMAYKQRPDCNCEQCKKDDDYLNELFNKDPPAKAKVTSVGSINTSLFGTPSASMGTPSSAGSVYTSPAATSFTFGTPTGHNDMTPTIIRPPKQETLRELLQKTTPTVQETIAQQTTPQTSGPPSFKRGSGTPASASLVMATNASKAAGDEVSTTGPSTPTNSSTFAFGGPVQRSTSGSFFNSNSDNIFRIGPNASVFGNGSPSIFGGGATSIFSAPKDMVNATIFGNKSASVPSDSGSNSSFTSSDNLFSMNPVATSNPSPVQSTKSVPTTSFQSLSATSVSTPPSQSLGASSTLSVSAPLFQSLGATSITSVPSPLFPSSSGTSSVSISTKNEPTTSLFQSPSDARNVPSSTASASAPLFQRLGSTTITSVPTSMFQSGASSVSISTKNEPASLFQNLSDSRNVPSSTDSAPLFQSLSSTTISSVPTSKFKNPRGTSSVSISIKNEPTSLFQSPGGASNVPTSTDSVPTPLFPSLGSSISSVSTTPPFQNSNTTNVAAIRTPGKTPMTSIFANRPMASVNIFGQTLFGTKAEPKVTDANLSFGSTTTTNLNESDEVVLKTDSTLSFASLAAQAGPKTEPQFATAKKGDENSPFAFLGAGAPVFGSPGLKKETNKEQLNKTQEGSDVEEVEGAEHDPHFEPIVPLPDQIVVSTGEEEETALFNERAKLYRYDGNTKEWKERGVGQLKVLFHPEHKTYRLLLRREQVHKVVLNQRIAPDFDLQPMPTSDKAWIWVGMNYCEDEIRLEQLAVKFKNTELTQAFKKCIEETVTMAAEIQANRSQLNDSLPTTVRDFGIEDISNEDVQTYNEDVQNYSEEVQNYDEEHYDEDEEDEDDDERSIMFIKRCTLSEQSGLSWRNVCMGELQVYYDPELYAARICVLSDSGETVSNTIIGANTIMEIQGKECWWKAVEWANAHELQWRTLKATFSSAVAAQEFHSNYLEGINYAQEVGAIDELPNEGDPLE